MDELDSIGESTGSSSVNVATHHVLTEGVASPHIPAPSNTSQQQTAVVTVDNLSNCPSHVQEHLLMLHSTLRICLLLQPLWLITLTASVWMV